MKYDKLEAKGITTIKLEPSDITTPLSKEQVLELFRAIANIKGVSGEPTILPNAKHEMLNNENGECILKDYIAVFESGQVFVNLGCCFFSLEDIKGSDEALAYEIYKELMPQACKAQPMITHKYAKRCYQKKQDALEILKKGGK